MTLKFPILILVLSFVAQWLSMRLGAFIRLKQGPLPKEYRDDFNVILGATLTLLGLIIGFTFSMALSRYDQRKDYEATEANAIGTEYLRIDLLPEDAAAHVHDTMKQYLYQRIQFYDAHNQTQLKQIDRSTAQLQNDLWAAVRVEGARQPTAVANLVISGMNDVLNSQAYTQAAWQNRIPLGAWYLMAVVAIFGGALIGNGAHTNRHVLFVFFSLIIAIAFFFVADLDDPRSGLVRVVPQNLVSLGNSLK